MDAYEATRIVFSRVQSLDPENAAKIMGLLLIQDHGEKEMIRLAFGPETTLHSVVLKARKELGLASSTPVSPSSRSAAPHPFLLRQNSASARVLPPSPLAVSSPSSWAAPPVFSRSHSSSNNGGSLSVSLDELQSCDELVSPSNPSPSPFYNGAGAVDIMDEFHLQDQLSFLNDPTATATNSNHSASIGSKPGAAAGDLFFPDVECRSASGGDGDNFLLPYGMGWGVNGQHRRSCSAAAASDLYLGSDAAGLGWKPCLYFARGYCKNGTACRFLHGLSDETAAAAGAKMDAVVEQQCQELLLRSKSQRIAGGGMSQLMTSAFPFSPTGSVPPSPSSSKCLNFLLQQQQNESQRAAAAAAAAALMLGGDESHKFVGRSRLERDLNLGSRQIYLTFPADSTFREEDVSNYFSIYGPVQDVRIPYQQKRMFGFVTFVYPETVKLILAKGNPHFVCDARVLVKPYKEKGKVPDKYRNKPQQSERGDYSGCSTPTGLGDSRDPFDLPYLGARMLYNNGGTQELLLRRRLEEQQQQQQQQALELQQAIELQRSRFMGLQLLDLKSRSLSSSAPVSINSPTITISTSTPTTTSSNSNGSSSSQEESPPEDKSPIAVAAAPSLKLNSRHGFLQQQQPAAVNAAEKEGTDRAVAASIEDSDFRDSVEHNLPDSPFASPTKSSIVLDVFSGIAGQDMASSNVNTAVTTSYMANNNGGGSNGNSLLISPVLLPPTTLDMASLTSRFFQMPRFSSSHGAAGL